MATHAPERGTGRQVVDRQLGGQWPPARTSVTQRKSVIGPTKTSVKMLSLGAVRHGMLDSGRRLAKEKPFLTDRAGPWTGEGKKGEKGGGGGGENRSWSGEFLNHSGWPLSHPPAMASVPAPARPADPLTPLPALKRASPEPQKRHCKRDPTRTPPSSALPWLTP